MAKVTVNEDEIRDDDVVVFILKINPHKSRRDLISPEMSIGHRIHDAIGTLGTATIREVAVKTGYSTARVKNHVAHHINLKRPKFEIKSSFTT